MKKIAMLIASGYEEVEMLAVVDVLRRAGMVCDIVSTTTEKLVTSSHHVTVQADLLFEEADFDSYDALVIPGGLPGTTNLAAHAGTTEQLRKAYDAGKLVAAICAAPTVFGGIGILQGVHATCYPGHEGDLTGALYEVKPVVAEGNIITSRGMGTAIEFGLTIVEYFTDKETADALAKKIIYTRL